MYCQTNMYEKTKPIFIYNEGIQQRVVRLALQAPAADGSPNLRLQMGRFFAAGE